MARGQGEGSIRQRTRRDGSQFWEARVTLNGRRVSYYDETKTGALKKARAARADNERGLGREVTNVTVERHLLDWLEVVRPTVRASTFGAYAGHVHTWLVPHLGRIKLVDLTPAHVRTMLAAVVAAGRSDATVVRIRATLASALRQAQVDYGLPRNVATLARPPKSAAPAYHREVLTVDDAHQLLAAFEGSRLWPLVAFAIGTGLRQGEQLALHWADVDLDKRLLHVRYSLDLGKRLVRPKTKKSARTLRLSALAIEALEVQRKTIEVDRVLVGDGWKDQDLVFPGPSGEIRSGSSLTHLFQERLERKGVPVIRWHALRRLCSALLQDQGVPITVVRDILGHSSLQVTEGYAYVMPAALLDAMDTLEGALGPDSNRGTDGVRNPSQPD